MTYIYLVRHCEAMGNHKRLFQGSTDCDISEIGAKQLEFLKEFTEVNGISGDEKEASRVMKSYLEGYVDEFDYDNLGSLISIKKGRQNAYLFLLK